MAPEITQIEAIEFTYPLDDVAQQGQKLVYRLDNRTEHRT